MIANDEGGSIVFSDVEGNTKATQLNAPELGRCVLM